jgi:aryl-alcohol dehydrogenase-like predicted oxidoreductase
VTFTRRAFLAASGALLACSRGRARQAATEAVPDAAPVPKKEGESMLTRKIPSSGEELPVIGLGTSNTFDVGESDEDRAPAREVVRRFAAAGGRAIDSSPMYGRAEDVTGAVVTALGTPMWLATKVWTRGRDEGIAQMKRSMQRLRAEKLDLMRVHNLLDTQVHLPVMREWKAAGTFRYLGITHYQLGAFGELEKVMRAEKLDFIQLPYSVAVREAEKRLLPAAAETGTAVLVMRPFEDGDLFRHVKGKALPAWAAEIDCTSWAQVFLKWILGHPSVTCPIPATSKPEHMDDNARAGFGRLPDEALRKRIVADLGF